MPGLIPTQQDIDQFVAITQASPEDAEHFLSAGVTLEVGAIENFFAAQVAGEAGTRDVAIEDEADEDELDEAIMTDPAPGAGAGGHGQTGSGQGTAYTLDGRPIETSLPEGWGQPARNMLGRIGQWGGGGRSGNTGSDGPRIATFGSLNRADDDDHDGPPPPRNPQDPNEFYAGGERSGIAVQGPDRPRQGGPRGLVDEILQQARSVNSSAGPLREPVAPSSSWFGGAGNTLGSDETPSAVVPDPNAPDDDEEEEEEAVRRVTFWRDGFSIEDGPLYRYDAPGTNELLAAIQNGRAPPSLFNVRYDQPLQVVCAERRTEDYRPPPKGPLQPFTGGGNRLGSPAPAIAGSGSNTPTMPGGLPQSGASGSTSNSAAATAKPAPSFAVDDSKPLTSIQVRLGDGTRMVARVNLSHTVGDLRSFVAAARSDPRPFVLQTTFPSRELSDESETVEMAKLANAVVVQRFT